MDVTELRSRITGLTIADQDRFRRRVAGASRIGVRSKRDGVLAAIERDLTAAEHRIAARRAAVPKVIAFPEELPITARRRDLETAIAAHQVVIVAGETGSGKSTQLPKLCLGMGRGVSGLIGHTQPRRLAAIAIAERVAEELSVPVGGPVGYAIRFTDRVADDTVVKLMTDGLLLAEIHRDPHLLAYDTLILDEAHERSLNIDFLLGYLHRLLPRRPDLKVIVTSATIDTERFSAHFGDAPVVEVSGRSHPVEVRYRPPAEGGSLDQPEAICAAVRELAGEGPGDILVFCSGEREIRDAADALAEMRLPETEILPLYARLSSTRQHQIFAPHRGRRIVVATNVAETSLTVPGIRFVVDPGTARISRYSRRTRVQRLPIEPVSRASADQRAGRCGRTGPGVCIRLYDEADYGARPRFTEPEIQRTNLASVLLQMAASRLGDIETFPFIDPPDRRAIRDGLALLEELQAIEGPALRLTRVGTVLARLPVDPRLGRMLVEADRLGCLSDVLVIVAALSIVDPRERPPGDEQKADARHARHAVAGSDLLGWLRLWERVRTERKPRTSGQFRRWCREEFLDPRRIREWQDVHAQLRQLCVELGMSPGSRAAPPDIVHRAVLSGLLTQLGRKDPAGHEYRGARGTRFSVAPGSALFRQAPEWVMAADLVETSRLWARGVAEVDPSWIEEAAAHLLSRSYSDPWWDPERGSAMAHETVTLHGIPVVTARPVALGRLDPVTAKAVFLRSALVHGEWGSDHGFVARNKALLAEVEELEARFRRDLRVDDDALVAFFDARVPDEVVSSRHFDAWWRTVRDPGLLDLGLEDVVSDVSVLDDEAATFPEVWHHGDLELPISYEFDPTSEWDGVVVDVPAPALDRLDPSVFEWHVPGHRQELVVALIRSLPKRLRTRFLPVGATADEVLAAPAQGGLIEHLRRELSRLGGVTVLSEDFDLKRLPPHLRPRFRVVDTGGAVLAVGDDLSAIRDEVRATVRAEASAAAHPIERTGLTEWSFGELPRVVRLTGRANTVSVYPAIVDEGRSVGIRLFATEAEQAEEMWFGTRRLLALGVTQAPSILRPLVTRQAAADLGLGPYESRSDWVEDCVECAVDAVLRRAGGVAWDGVAFDRLVRRVRSDVGDELLRVGAASLSIMAALRDLQIAVEGATAPLFAEAVEDVRSQVVRLVYPGFLAGVGPDRLEDVERYLRAMVWRLDRLPENPRRDASHLATMHALETEHDRLRASLPDGPALRDIGWMLQELRVSLFAQALGTRVSVSPIRVEAALRDAVL